MTFEILSGITPWFVGFVALTVLGLALAAYGVVGELRSRRVVAAQPAVARTREQQVRGRLALHH